MRPKPSQPQTGELFRARLDEQINMRHRHPAAGQEPPAPGQGGWGQRTAAAPELQPRGPTADRLGTKG